MRRLRKQKVGQKNSDRLMLCLYSPLRPVLPTQSDVALVAAELDLFPFLDDLSITDPRIIRRLPSAPADGFDLLDGVGPGQKPVGSFKQISLEISA